MLQTLRYSCSTSVPKVRLLGEMPFGTIGYKELIDCLLVWHASHTPLVSMACQTSTSGHQSHAYQSCSFLCGTTAQVKLIHVHVYTCNTIVHCCHTVQLCNPQTSTGVSASCISAADRLAKPTEAEQKILGKLFPSSKSSTKRPSSSRPFDPTVDCSVSIRQKKKKAATTEGRPTNVKVVVLPKLLPAIPKGVRRSQMCKGGRIKSLLFKRSMSCSEVRSVIRRGFSHLGLEKWKYLESSRNNILSVSECQEIDGGVVVTRKGCLYVCEEVGVVWCSSSIILYYQARVDASVSHMHVLFVCVKLTIVQL